MNQDYQVEMMKFRIIKKLWTVSACKRRDLQQVAGGRGSSGNLFAMALTGLVESEFITIDTNRVVTLIRSAKDFTEPKHPSLPSWDKSGRKFVPHDSASVTVPKESTRMTPDS